MAFVLNQTWDATNPYREDHDGASASSALLAPLLADGRDRYAWKTGAVLLSVLVHILILWLFLTRLAGSAGDGDGAGSGSGILHSFSLSDSSASAAAPAREKAEVPPLPPAAVQPSDVDASAQSGLVPEWSVSRLPPRPAPPSASPSPAAGASAGASPGTGAAGAGSGGAEVYDPYAGAAPLRRERGAPAAPSLGDRVLGFFGLGPQAAGGLTLDEGALEAVRRAVARALPGRRGTAELTVRVSPTGVVLEANARGGSAPVEVRDALGRALVGKRLFLGSAVDAQTLTLPTLRLG
ncbi:MAG TPA: hypothetical protein VK472_00650 [Allosphingosinicella sp.]|nr:hypothetical protein [Allosphingosinicella sp.]